MDLITGGTGSSNPEVKMSIVDGKGAQYFDAAVEPVAIARAGKKMFMSFILINVKTDGFWKDNEIMLYSTVDTLEIPQEINDAFIYVWP